MCSFPAMPTVDDIIHKLNGAKVFSKIDFRSGYHQLMLDDESRYITTFSTHKELYRYKQLNFGISSTSEIFQKAISDLITDIDGAENISDDCIIGGADQEDHDRILLSVLWRLIHNGLTINLPKYAFSKPRVEFYGFLFLQQGVSPMMDKVKALHAMQTPHQRW